MASKAVVPCKVHKKHQKSYDGCLRLLARDKKPCTNWSDLDFAYWKSIVKATTIVMHTEDIEALELAVKMYIPHMVKTQQRMDALDLFYRQKRVNQAVAARIVGEEQGDYGKIFDTAGLQALVDLAKKDPKRFEGVKFYLATKFRVFVNHTRKALTFQKFLDKVGAKGSLSDSDILAIEDKSADIEIEG